MFLRQVEIWLGAMLLGLISGALTIPCASAATGAQGLPLKIPGAINCGHGIEVQLKNGYRFKAGPSAKYPSIRDNFDEIRYDTRVIARYGNWVDLDGSIDLWVSIKDVFIEIKKSSLPTFDIHDRCLNGIEVRYIK